MPSVYLKDNSFETKLLESSTKSVSNSLITVPEDLKLGARINLINSPLELLKTSLVVYFEMYEATFILPSPAHYFFVNH